MGGLETVFWVMLLLGIMILIHEAGHYWAAVAVGVKVETFSIGFGPRLFGFRRGETDFRISAIPFGGYVKMLGEQPGDENATDPRSFQGRARWQRVIVIVAGPLMNILLAVVIVTGLFMHAFPRQVDSTNPVISRIMPGSAAARAGLQAGDRIVQIERHQHPTWQDVQTREVLSGGHPLPVTIERGKETKYLTVTPELDAKEGVGVAGWLGEPDVQVDSVVPDSPAAVAGLQPGDLLISAQGQPISSPMKIQQVVSASKGSPIDLAYLRHDEIRKVVIKPVSNPEANLPWRIGVKMKERGEVVKLPFHEAMYESLRFNTKNATLIFQVLGSIVQQRISPKTLVGPIGIAQQSKEAAREGLISFLALMSMVSLNLAVFNLLPIPILDGGMLVLLLVEMVIRRDMSLQLKETVFKLSFVFLMMLVVFVLYNDISKLFANG